MMYLIADKDEKEKSEKKSTRSGDKPYKLSQDAFKVARDRHNKGLMHPWVFQILAHVRLCFDKRL